MVNGVLAHAQLYPQQAKECVRGSEAPQRNTPTSEDDSLVRNHPRPGMTARGSPELLSCLYRPRAAGGRPLAGLECVEKLLTAMIRVGALGGWSDPTSHRPAALKLICRPAA